MFARDAVNAFVFVTG